MREIRGEAAAEEADVLWRNRDIWEKELLRLKRRIEITISQRRAWLEQERLRCLDLPDGRARFLREKARFADWRRRRVHVVRLIEDRILLLQEERDQDAIQLVRRAMEYVADEGWLAEARSVLAA